MWILPETYLAALVAFGALNVLAACVALLAGTRAVGVRRVWIAALVVSVLTVGELAVAKYALGANLFAIIMLAWIDSAFVVPLSGAALLVAAWRGRAVTRVARRIAVAAVIAIPPLAAYASLIEPFDLRLETAVVRLAETKDGSAPITVAVFADLQTTRVGDHEREAAARLMAEEPDVILVPGDLFHGPHVEWERTRAGLKEVVASLRAPGGVWVVTGNCDYRPGLPWLMEGTQARLLSNRTVEVTVRDRRLRILGIEDGRASHEVVRRFEREAAADPGAVHLLLTHRPGVGLALQDTGAVDLVVAGHTHGGQVCVPLLGPPLTLSIVPRRVAAGGLHELAGNRYYVSRGVGMERHWAPRVRFLCPPEITLLRLE